MGETVATSPLRSQKRSWMVTTVTTLLLVMAIIAGGAALYTTQAAAPDPVTGHYDLRAVTTTGPQRGRYITGVLALIVSTTGKISGLACGMNYAPSSCLALSGTTPDNMQVTLKIVKSKNPGFYALSLSGAFHLATGARGSYTGFVGTFTFGNGGSTSSGNWEGINNPFPSTSGSWKLHMLVTSGHDRGHVFDGMLILVQSTSKDTSVGTFTLNSGTAVPANGINQNGSVLLSINKPAQFVLKGTFTVTGGAGRMNGQFYMPGSGTGSQNDRGYWVAHQ